MKLSSFLASSSLLLATAAAPAACGGGDSPPAFDAHFKTASQEQIARAVSAGAGYDYGLAFFLGAAYSGIENPTGCPAVTVSGSVTTVTGGCDTDDGHIDGTIVLDNVPGLFGGDANPTRAQSLTFEGWRMTSPDEDDVAIDGTIVVEAGHATVDLTVDLGGMVADSSFEMVCSTGDGGPCGPADGGWIDVDGLGGAAVSGAWTLGDPPSGKLTLTGADTFVLDFDNAGSDGCVPYAIDGAAAGELCQ
ncbi:MAG: hypothetical protein H6709_06165 [Kofleriaceae bacterium]|nr:hypothetical protein [Myxococcales bacterium]MCB9560411.1 hypothetical protein [Kofleriaceae bacterium]MCB9571659.1 hypothetical protein [Kofleriaceae bacterium]